MPPAPPDSPPAPGASPEPGGTRPPARRCRLSVLFCDLCDSTALSGALEAEDYAELLAALRQTAEAGVAQYGGTIVRLQGDGMLAVFGYPLPREGDGRRAVLAALRLHEAVRQLDQPWLQAPGTRRELRLHSGIHSGVVLVQGGDLVIGRLELLGMVPNIAAHLSGAAGRDEVLVSEETLGPALRHFRTGAQRLVRVQGHERPLACRPVAGRADAAAAARPGAPQQPFVGRQAELERLEQRLGEALAGATRQLALLGPAGVGKTRLAAEFLQRAARKGCRVLGGYSEGELDAAPLQPLLHMLRGALGVVPGAAAAEVAPSVESGLATLGLQDLAPSLLPLLGAAPAGRAPRPPEAEAAQHALGRFFASLAERQPLLLFFDDWHWSDAATRQALAAICAAALGPGLMVVFSMRSLDPGDASMRQMEAIELAPFSAAEGAASIHALLPAVDPFLAEQIYRYSGGNPLFIEELCHSAAAGGTSLQGPQRPAGQHAGAAWLQVLIESRVQRLPPAQLTLLRTLAVIGNVVPAWLLAALTGLAPGDEALRELTGKDLLFPEDGGTLRFKHGLTRDVIYESVGLRERRTLHAHVAQALQGHAVAGTEVPHEALAYHFGAAGLAAEAAQHAEAAGDRAAALSALDRAKALYHAALTHLQASALDTERTRRWLAISNKLGLICVFDASRRDLPVFEQGVRLAQASGDAALQARSEYWLGYILYALGQARDAVQHSERAAALAGPGDDALAVQIRATLGQAKAAASDYAGAWPLLENAVQIKRRHRHGSAKLPVGLAYSLVCLASVAGDRGEFARAYDLFDEAWRLVRGATHEIGASIQGWLAVVLGWQGRWAEAVVAAQESTHIAEQTHSLFQFCQGRATGAYAHWMLQGEPASVDKLAESTLWLEPRDSGLFRSLDHGWLAECWFARGERARARRHAALALHRGRAGDVIGVALAWRALARDAAARRDFARATHCLDAAQRLASWRESLHEAAANDLCAAEVALAAEERGDARRLAEAAAEAFGHLQMRWHGEQAQALLART